MASWEDRSINGPELGDEENISRLKNALDATDLRAPQRQLRDIAATVLSGDFRRSLALPFSSSDPLASENLAAAVAKFRGDAKSEWLRRLVTLTELGQRSASGLSRSIMA